MYNNSLYNSSLYLSSTTILLSGYRKILDTINSCETEEQLNSAFQMVYNFQRMVYHNLLKLKSNIFKNILFHPYRTIKDYYSYSQLMWSVILEIKEVKDNIEAQLNDASQDDDIHSFRVQGFQDLEK